MNTTLQSASKLMSLLGLRVVTDDVAKHSKFNRLNLPSAKAFWETHGIVITPTKGWIMAKCVFHQDQHASLGINAETGGFFCHACGAKGGDVLAAYQLLNGCDFVAGAKALGAWEEE